MSASNTPTSLEPNGAIDDPLDRKNSRPVGGVEEEPLLEISGLHKTLGANKVLKGIEMKVYSGEIHALVGGNGAGKSTLIKCLSGYWQPDQGVVQVAGEPLETHKGQIAFVQQDLGLIDSLSVVENTCLGRGFTTGLLGKIRWGEEVDRVAKLLAELGHADIDPRSEVRLLSPVQRTVVAIARATQSLHEGARLLILDEPTATLPVNEADRLFETVRRLRSLGVGMIYISHHLSEVLDLVDRVSVLRDGELVCTDSANNMTEEQIVSEMLGRDLDRVSRTSEGVRPDGLTPVLELERLSGPNVRDINFDIYPGQIVGLAGLQGSGCTEIAELIFGVEDIVSGTMQLDGQPVEFGHPKEAVEAGVALVTEDRHLNGCFLDQTIGDNITVTDVRRFFHRGWLSRRGERAESKKLMEVFEVYPAQEDKRFSTFSGGNQQKAIVAKWVRTDPKLIVCDQPDIGVDVGAKQAIYRALQTLVDNGSGALLISNQYDDLEALCDRVIVLQSGKVSGVLAGDKITQHEISRIVTGGNPEGEREAK